MAILKILQAAAVRNLEFQLHWLKNCYEKEENTTVILIFTAMYPAAKTGHDPENLNILQRELSI